MAEAIVLSEKDRAMLLEAAEALSEPLTLNMRHEPTRLHIWHLVGRLEELAARQAHEAVADAQ